MPNSVIDNQESGIAPIAATKLESVDDSEQLTDDSKETIIKPDVTVNIDTDIIAKKLDIIARRLDTLPDDVQNNVEKLNYFSENDEKSIRGDDGHKLKDYELYRIVLDRINEKERETGIKVPISHEFKQYMKDYVREVGSGLKTDAEFKSERLENDVDINRVDIDNKVLKNKEEG